jgi:hypothetical protein
MKDRGHAPVFFLVNFLTIAFVIYLVLSVPAFRFIPTASGQLYNA